MDCIYCTPEWLEESARIYRATPRFEEMMKRLSVQVFFRVTAKPEWGIDSDFIFGGTITKGVLDELRYFSEDEVKEKGELVMAASPQEWKLLLRKEHKFLTDFMLRKINLEKGGIKDALAVAPYADSFINALTQVKLIFQDELSAQQLNEYREYATQFRSKLGV
jgi:putative sterol carrier protein